MYASWITALSLAFATPCLANQNSTLLCNSEVISFPEIPGTQQSKIKATILKDYPARASGAQDFVSQNVTLNFCNVTVQYGHQDWEDQITVTVWLPLAWNGRLMGIGGGGLASLADFEAHAWAVYRGYAAVGTDSGHDNNVYDASSWALKNGTVNFNLLQNFFASSQHEASIIGKEVVKSAYGESPQFSYWNGCSTGGRQGFLLAQRYPDAYDGVLAGSPAINWAHFVPGMYYPQLVMNNAQHFPPACVFDFANKGAVQACDQLDGVTDNIISHPDKCNFSASALVGQQVSCNDKTLVFDEKDAEVVDTIWDGPRWEDGTPIWFGLQRGTSFVDLASIECNGTVCGGAPFGIASNWIGQFVQQKQTFDLTTLTPQDFTSVMARSIAAYKSLTSTDNPDLRDFKDAGGKLLHWHGTADTEIFHPGSELYYNRAEARDPEVRDYYRFFEAPGGAHCGPGNGFSPADPLAQLIEWVEKGHAPDVLPAVNINGTSRILRPYPLEPII